MLTSQLVLLNDDNAKLVDGGGTAGQTGQYPNILTYSDLKTDHFTFLHRSVCVYCLPHLH